MLSRTTNRELSISAAVDQNRQSTTLRRLRLRAFLGRADKVGRKGGGTLLIFFKFTSDFQGQSKVGKWPKKRVYEWFVKIGKMQQVICKNSLLSHFPRGEMGF